MDVWVISTFLAAMNNVTINFQVQVFVWGEGVYFLADGERIFSFVFVLSVFLHLFCVCQRKEPKPWCNFIKYFCDQVASGSSSSCRDDRR